MGRLSFSLGPPITLVHVCNSLTFLIAGSLASIGFQTSFADEKDWCADHGYPLFGLGSLGTR